MKPKGKFWMKLRNHFLLSNCYNFVSWIFLGQKRKVVESIGVRGVDARVRGTRTSAERERRQEATAKVRGRSEGGGISRHSSWK